MIRPVEQWWTINGHELLSALRRVGAGDDPDVAYMELFANADAERPA